MNLSELQKLSFIGTDCIDDPGTSEQALARLAPCNVICIYISVLILGIIRVRLDWSYEITGMN